MKEELAFIKNINQFRKKNDLIHYHARKRDSKYCFNKQKYKSIKIRKNT